MNVHPYPIELPRRCTLVPVTFVDSLQHLKEVFRQLSQHGLKLQPQKCHFLRQEVKYLGHVMGPRGVAIVYFLFPLRLYTNASLKGLGSVLAQVQEGQERVITYAS
ncbi:hypothetical protein SKAU_G00157500 [Synaphobranchus kaupii]|uniref:Reverse transcriptase n=1 Tax=Synaphobranchus kaupii TaxID=118154 RepID=A0A9Q1FIE1_SYNKA|nr:hypothetical protein SKAU_G00157500 [Synaphobranchus kaupii]